MSFVSLTELLQDARMRKYALPAFNAWTFQDALAYVRAAEKAESPLVIQTSGTCIQHNGLEFAFHMVKNAAKNANTPIVIHLDHARDLGLIRDALDLGYQSVMFDGSDLLIEENIKATRIVKKAAENYDVSVEAEIGHVPKGKGDLEVLTTPEDAIKFVEAVRVDALAVAVGTKHGMQKRKGAVRFKLVDALSQAVKTPLVLHGSSGIKDVDLPILAASGVCKVNFATRLRCIFIQAAGDLASSFTDSDHIKFLMTAYEKVTEESVYIMEQLNSARKA